MRFPCYSFTPGATATPSHPHLDPLLPHPAPHRAPKCPCQNCAGCQGEAGRELSLERCRLWGTWASGGRRCPDMQMMCGAPCSSLRSSLSGGGGVGGEGALLVPGTGLPSTAAGARNPRRGLRASASPPPCLPAWTQHHPGTPTIPAAPTGGPHPGSHWGLPQRLAVRVLPWPKSPRSPEDSEDPPHTPLPWNASPKRGVWSSHGPNHCLWKAPQPQSVLRRCLPLHLGVATSWWEGGVQGPANHSGVGAQPSCWRSGPAAETVAGEPGRSDGPGPGQGP